MNALIADINGFHARKILKGALDVEVFTGQQRIKMIMMETETDRTIGISYMKATSTKSRKIALILCIFGGWLGLHEFYVGKSITGIIYLLTAGLFGLGWIISLLAISMGNFRDNNNAVLRNW